MHKKMSFLRVFQKIAILVCVFCAFFISPVFATLPAGYTELEYIESTGTQYIDTGIIPVNTEDFYIRIYHVDDGPAWGGDNFVTARASTTDYFRIFFTEGRSAGALPLNTWLEGVYSASTRVFTMHGNSVTQEGEACVATMNLFRRSSGASGSARISRVKMGERADLIPAKRNSDGEIGMYDLVSNTFFTNQGTGEFIAGPVAYCKTFGTDGVTCAACKSGYRLDNSGGCVEIIEIATTKMVDEEFAQAEANLAATVQTIESVVSRTIAQTGQIQILQDTKQTRPDESCPANMKCLLVQDEDGTPHWYPIIEP